MSEGVRTFRLDKLVRDEIVEQTEAQGGTVDYEVLTGEAKIRALIKKLGEEAGEATVEITLVELADVKEVVEQIAAEKGATPADLERIQQTRRELVGGLKAGHYIHQLSLPASNMWADYYASDPDRFPEVDTDSLRQMTVATYDTGAERFEEYFKNIGVRTPDIDKAFELAAIAGDGQARVVELGCGNGREAEVITKRSAFYEGVDNSQGMIDLARPKAPNGNFKVASMTDYEFPDNLDVIFAFASLLHVDKDETKAILGKAAIALRPGGIFYISSKARPDYEPEVQYDEFGARLFYYYSPENIQELAGSEFETALLSTQNLRGTDWFTLGLKKK